jgi:hypothetical protein
LSERDDHAQLVISGDGNDGNDGNGRRVFRDDALGTFLRRAYRRLRDGRRADFAPQLAVARLLCEAKERCRTAEGPGPAGRKEAHHAP